MNLSDIKGLGAANIKKLNNAGIETPQDLVLHFPKKYIDLSMAGRFDLAGEGDDFAAMGKVIDIQKKFIRKDLSYVKAELVATDGTRFVATWFNQPYIIRSLKIDESYFILGKLKVFMAGKNAKYEISAPSIQPISKGFGIIPVYKSIGLPKNLFENCVDVVLKSINFLSIIPKDLCKQYNLMDINQALRSMHSPKTIQEAADARYSFSLQNLAVYIAYFMLAKKRLAKNKPFKYDPIKGDEYIEKIKKSLPFFLTGKQESAINQIIKLMNLSQPMNALLEGDVGCGKTIVCFLAIAYCVASGHQGVLMAPTEILARQHYQSAVKIFGVQNVEFVCGSQTASARNASRVNIENGVAKVIIGTHSLFSDDIKFRDLVLVVTDEQHRFGVNQRGALENKAVLPDCIVMSATPIPRTLALTLYGDLQLISINQKPKQKAKIFTRFVSSKIKEMYDYILAKTEKGEQAYIVCPRIKEEAVDDELQDESKEELKNVVDLFEELKKTALKDTVVLLHGQMKDAEKTRAMELFVSGEKKVLIATTVIEVGIDVPSATTMVVYNAERYGLSQLHQLRGRIGRGGIDSYCFLLATKEAYESRLKLLGECDDGFVLAERDFEIRGAGDFLGVRQHGKSLTLTGEPVTLELLTKAKEIASRLAIRLDDIPKEQLSYFKDLTLN